MSNRNPAFMSAARVCFWMLLLAARCEAAEQDWSISVTGQPAANAAVGDVVGVAARISVDAGVDELTVNAIYMGATTTGLSAISFPPPMTLAAGTSADAMITMLVVAPPGSSGVHLQVEVDGTLGTVSGIRSANSNSIAVLEGVVAVLSGAAPQVHRGDQIAYDLALVSNSDSVAQIAVPVSGFDVPVGTALITRTRGVSTLAAGSATNYGLVVAVSDSNDDGTSIVMTPTGATYTMSQVGIFNRAMPVIPPSVSSIVVVPIFVDGFE